MVDPRLPVIVGVGQVVATGAGRPRRARRSTSWPTRAASPTPTAGATRSLLDQVGVVAIAQIGSWRYPDPGALLARRLGIEPRATLVSTVGGNSPQLLVNELADRIQRNDLDVALVGGAESMHTRWRARREPRVELTWETGDDDAVRMGDRRRPARHERVRGCALRARAAARVPALRDRAARRGRSARSTNTKQHVSELWSRFAAVAAGNPNAWSQQAVHARGDPHGLARQPHGVLPVPEAHVRQHRRGSSRGGAPVLLRGRQRGRCARRPDGVPPRGGRGARSLLLQRALVARRLARASRPRSATRSPPPASRVDDVARFDLYSCFPSAVQVAMRALGLARRRHAPAHRYRRSRLRGRPGEQLSDPRDRAHGRTVARRSGQLRLHHRARLVHLEARDGRLVGNAARRRVPPRRSRDEPGEGRRPPPPRAGRTARRPT